MPHGDDGGSYNPDGYGCRKPTLTFLALLALAVAALCFWL